VKDERKKQISEIPRSKAAKVELIVNAVYEEALEK